MAECTCPSLYRRGPHRRHASTRRDVLMRAAVLVGLLAVVACDSNPADGGSDSSSSVDASTSDANVDTSPPCDLTGDPASAPCSVSDANGVFVSPSGSDASGDGRQAHPYASIGVAVTKAKAAAMVRVFVCAGTYADALSLGASASGTKIRRPFVRDMDVRAVQRCERVTLGPRARAHRRRCA